MHRGIFALGSLILACVPLWPRTVPAICGFHRENWKEELLLSRRASLGRLLEQLSTGRAAEATPGVREVGQLVLMEDTGGVVARRNAFNLHNRTVRFLPVNPSASRYRFEVAAASYDEALAVAGTPLAGLGDDDFQPLALPFEFAYYGARWRQAFVHSDGNVTFERPDAASTDRSLGRLTSGPPRVAPLFNDLDPSIAGGTVRVTALPTVVAVSWVNQPEYRDFGIGPRQTFQLRLYPEGRIEFAYQSITTLEGVVGIAPGGLRGSAAVVPLLAGSTAEFDAAVAERFTGSDQVDITRLAQRFYESYEDAYDYLVIFNTLGISPGANVVANETTIRSTRRGIGDTLRDVGAEFGSAYRLQSVLNMGPLSQYPVDPNAAVGFRGRITGDTLLTILGHEAGHLFLALASTRDEENPQARPLLGAQNAHWSFNFNSEASLLEGNRIEDLGPGVAPRFRTTATVQGYSPLDQYLMGLRAPAEVPPVFLVRNSPYPAAQLPQAGVRFSGTREDVRVEDIIAAEGQRRPDHTVEQSRYRFAFVVLHAAGQEPPAVQLEQVETYRRAFEPYYLEATSGRGAAETSLRRMLRLSAFPATGVLAGGEARAVVSLARPAAAPLVVSLRTAQGAAAAPASVTVPAGAASAGFTLRGLRAGVEELSAEAAGGFETATARVQVRDGAAGLSLAVSGGAGQTATPGAALPEPVAFRATDVNGVPYAGLAVRASEASGGAVEPAETVTDESGVARFRWTPGAGPLRLTATLAANPTMRATAAALRRPALDAGGAVNAASYAPGLTPGAFASLFGGGFLEGGIAVSAPPFPTRLAGVEVFVNGAAMPLVAVTPGQINLLLPAALPAGQGQVVVSTAAGRSEPLAVAVEPVLPGLFFDSATGFGAVRVVGAVVELYGTGFGPLRPSARFPGLEEVDAAVTVTIGGRPADVLFAGLSPGTPGLNQVNIARPAGLAAGVYDVVVTVAGRRSNSVRVRLE